jgi:hypothetical protein
VSWLTKAHRSLEQGIFKNDVWASVFGFVAAAASFRSGWAATAAPAAEGAGPARIRRSVDSPRYEDALALPSLLALDGDGIAAAGSAATA